MARCHSRFSRLQYALRWLPDRHVSFGRGGLPRARRRSCNVFALPVGGRRKLSTAGGASEGTDLSLCKGEQLVRIAQHDSLASALDQILLLPRTEDPADGMQRRADHLRDILTADREIDLYARASSAPRLLGKSQQHVSDALLDLLAGHFEDAGLDLLQPMTNRPQRIHGQAREFCRQPGPCRRWPAQGDTLDRGDCSSWICLQRERRCHAEDLAGRNVTDYDLLSLRRRLLNPQMAMQQDEERIGVGALIEHGRIFRISNRAGFTQGLVELAGGKPGEQGDIGDRKSVV